MVMVVTNHISIASSAVGGHGFHRQPIGSAIAAGASMVHHCRRSSVLCGGAGQRHAYVLMTAAGCIVTGRHRRRGSARNHRGVVGVLYIVGRGVHRNRCLCTGARPRIVGDEASVTERATWSSRQWLLPVDDACVRHLWCLMRWHSSSGGRWQRPSPRYVMRRPTILEK